MILDDPVTTYAGRALEQLGQIRNAIPIPADRWLLAAAVAGGGVLSAVPAHAQCDGGDGAATMSKVLANDGAANEQFSHAVGVSGDVSIGGAYKDNENGPQSGSAYIYRSVNGAWTQEQKLTPSDPGGGDRFGVAVAISGNTAVIGSKGDDDNGNSAGAAYIFRYNGSTWVQEQKLLAADGASWDYFGSSVAIDGNVAVIGSFSDTHGYDSGSAYVFRFNGSSWVQEVKLMSSDGGTSQFFGAAVAVSGDMALIGAYGDDDGGWDAGAAYAFRFDGSGWIEEHKFVAYDAEPFDEYGSAVAVDGDLTVIGSYNDGNSGTGGLDGHGSAYVYGRNGSVWTMESKLLASDGSSTDRFGFSVAVSDERVLVGAYLDDDMGGSSGSAYLFTKSGSVWSQDRKILADDGAYGDKFGLAVALSGDRAMIGAAYDDDNGADAGSAYLVTEGGSPPPITDCNDNGIDDVCDIQNGESSDLDGNGVPDECEIVLGDVNGDGVVNVVDLAQLVAEWGMCEGPCPGDFNNDGMIDVLDLIAMFEAWS